MDLGLRGRLVVVTGASRGIGRAAAIAFGAEGARVVVTYHGNEPAARQAAEQVVAAGGAAYVRRLDLSDEDSIARLADGLHAADGPVDVLVNNAVGWPGLRHRTLQANLHGHLLLSRALVGPMRRQGFGRIVFVPCGAADDGRTGAASTWPHGLARTVSRELAGDGVRATVVIPGRDVPRDATPAEVVRVIMQHAFSRASSPTSV